MIHYVFVTNSDYSPLIININSLLWQTRKWNFIYEYNFNFAHWMVNCCLERYVTWRSCRLNLRFSVGSRFTVAFLPTRANDEVIKNSKFWYFADRASQYIYLNIKQLDALNFIMSLFHASTCLEHKCSSSVGQNCTIQSLVSSHL